MKIFGKYDYTTVQPKITAALEGSHRKISLGDVLLHSKGDKYILVWKRGSHVMVELAAPVEYLAEEGELERFNLAKGRLAIIASASRERR